MRTLDELADWGGWLPFHDALAHAEARPGVYVVRYAATGRVCYVGQEGGSVHGRLHRYQSGQGFTGLTQGLLDEAIRDGFMAVWKPQPDSVIRPSVQFMRDVLKREDLEVCVAYTKDRATARTLEAAACRVLLERGEPLLNKA
jgi:hypothetical protein